MKHYRLRLYNRIKYRDIKFTEDDIAFINIIIEYGNPTILGSDRQIKRLHDLADKFKKWYIN